MRNFPSGTGRLLGFQVSAICTKAINKRRVHGTRRTVHGKAVPGGQSIGKTELQSHRVSELQRAEGRAECLYKATP